jgi:uncharacterized protein (TIGR03435 family)
MTIGIFSFIGPPCTHRALAQSVDVAAGTYEVTSIKLATSKTTGRFGVRPGGQLEMGDQTLQSMIAFAYGLNCSMDDCLSRVIGGPAWVRSLKFEIVAKPAKPDPPMDTLARSEAAKPRVKALLAECFQLRVRAEDREMRVYVLRVAKGGAKIKEETDSSGEKPRVGFTMPFHAVGSYAPISSLVRVIQHPAGRPVIDRTGLTGTYHYELYWDPGYPVPRELLGGIELPSIFTAVREQLGLTLEPELGMVKTIVIEHVEKPNEN